MRAPRPPAGAGQDTDPPVGGQDRLDAVRPVLAAQREVAGPGASALGRPFADTAGVARTGDPVSHGDGLPAHRESTGADHPVTRWAGPAPQCRGAVGDVMEVLTGFCASTAPGLDALLAIAATDPAGRRERGQSPPACGLGGDGGRQH